MNTTSFLLRLSAYGALLTAMGIGCGAFGAHGLKKILSPEMLAIFEKAVFYHLVHSLALFCLPLFLVVIPQESERLTRAWKILCAGLLLFSGSLYAYAITGERWLAMITPFGGTLFIAGWIYVGAILVSHTWQNQSA